MFTKTRKYKPRSRAFHWESIRNEAMPPGTSICSICNIQYRLRIKQTTHVFVMPSYKIQRFSSAILPLNHSSSTEANVVRFFYELNIQVLVILRKCGPTTQQQTYPVYANKKPCPWRWIQIVFPRLLHHNSIDWRTRRARYPAPHTKKNIGSHPSRALWSTRRLEKGHVGFTTA